MWWLVMKYLPWKVPRRVGNKTSLFVWLNIKLFGYFYDKLFDEHIHYIYIIPEYNTINWRDTTHFEAPQVSKAPQLGKASQVRHAPRVRKAFRVTQGAQIGKCLWYKGWLCDGLSWSTYLEKSQGELGTRRLYLYDWTSSCSVIFTINCSMNIYITYTLYQSIIPSTDMTQLTLTLKMTTACRLS